MRYLLTALITILLVAPYAYSRVVMLPNDDTTSLGAISGVYVTHNNAAEPTTDDCFSFITSVKVSACVAGATTGINNDGKYPYSGTPYIRKLVCHMGTSIDHADTTYTIRVGVRGGVGDAAITYFTGSITYVFGDNALRYLPKVIEINSVAPIEDGVLEIVYTNVVDGGETGSSKWSCVLY